MKRTKILFFSLVFTIICLATLGIGFGFSNNTKTISKAGDPSYTVTLHWGENATETLSGSEVTIPYGRETGTNSSVNPNWYSENSNSEKTYYYPNQVIYPSENLDLYPFWNLFVIERDPLTEKNHIKVIESSVIDIEISESTSINVTFTNGDFSNFAGNPIGYSDGTAIYNIGQEYSVSFPYDNNNHCYQNVQVYAQFQSFDLKFYDEKESKISSTYIDLTSNNYWETPVDFPSFGEIDTNTYNIDGCGWATSSTATERWFPYNVSQVQVKNLTTTSLYKYYAPIDSGNTDPGNNNQSETASLTIIYNKGTAKDDQNNDVTIIGADEPITVTTNADKEPLTVGNSYKFRGATYFRSDGSAQIGWSPFPYGHEYYQKMFNLNEEIEITQEHINQAGESKTINLYPYWGTVYAVYYYPDDNTQNGVTKRDVKVQGETLTLRSLTYSRIGYEQIGWSTKKDSSVVEYAFGAEYTEDKAIAALYPVWKIKTYAVQVKISDPTIASVNIPQLQVPYGSVVENNGTTLTITSPTERNPYIIKLKINESTNTTKYTLDSWVNGDTTVRSDLVVTANVIAKQTSYSQAAKQEDGSTIYVEVSSSDGLVQNSTLSIKYLDSDKSSITIPENATLIQAYDLSLVNKRVAKTTSGTVNVKLSIPANITSTENLKVAIVEDGEVKLKDVKIEGNFLSFETASIGEFAVVRQAKTSNVVLIIVICVVSAVALVAIGLTIFYLSKKKRKLNIVKSDDKSIQHLIEKENYSNTKNEGKKEYISSNDSINSLIIKSNVDEPKNENIAPENTIKPETKKRGRPKKVEGAVNSQKTNKSSTKKKTAKKTTTNKSTKKPSSKSSVKKTAKAPTQTEPKKRGRPRKQ